MSHTDLRRLRYYTPTWTPQDNHTGFLAQRNTRAAIKKFCAQNLLAPTQNDCYRLTSSLF